jgi:hypothetical protein
MTIASADKISLHVVSFVDFSMTDAPVHPTATSFARASVQPETEKYVISTAVVLISETVAFKVDGANVTTKGNSINSCITLPPV